MFSVAELLSLGLSVSGRSFSSAKLGGCLGHQVRWGAKFLTRPLPPHEQPSQEVGGGDGRSGGYQRTNCKRDRSDLPVRAACLRPSAIPFPHLPATGLGLSLLPVLLWGRSATCSQLYQAVHACPATAFPVGMSGEGILSHDSRRNTTLQTPRAKKGHIPPGQLSLRNVKCKHSSAQKNRSEKSRVGGGGERLTGALTPFVFASR